MRCLQLLNIKANESLLIENTSIKFNEADDNMGAIKNKYHCNTTFLLIVEEVTSPEKSPGK